MVEDGVRRPAYIQLLNDICNQETGAGVFLNAWWDKSQDPRLKGCLNFVADRETSHGDIFRRRIRELGFAVVEKDDPAFAERLRVLGSDVPDTEKIRYLNEAGQSQPKPTVRDRYEAAMDDESVDPLTRSLLRWFADVEADSRDLMAREYARVEAAG